MAHQRNERHDAFEHTAPARPKPHQAEHGQLRNGLQRKHHRDDQVDVVRPGASLLRHARGCNGHRDDVDDVAGRKHERQLRREKRALHCMEKRAWPRRLDCLWRIMQRTMVVCKRIRVLQSKRHAAPDAKSRQPPAQRHLAERMAHDFSVRDATDIARSMAAHLERGVLLFCPFGIRSPRRAKHVRLHRRKQRDQQMPRTHHKRHAKRHRSPTPGARRQDGKHLPPSLRHKRAA